jgi:hypothetical protein
LLRQNAADLKQNQSAAGKRLLKLLRRLRLRGRRQSKLSQRRIGAVEAFKFTLDAFDPLRREPRYAVLAEFSDDSPLEAFVAEDRV